LPRLEIADKCGRIRVPCDLSRTCIGCSRSHSAVAGRIQKPARFESLPVRQPGALCPRPPQRLADRRSLHRQPRRSRCPPPRCLPRSVSPPRWGVRPLCFEAHSSGMPCRRCETGQSFCQCQARPSRWVRSASWCRQRPARVERALQSSRNVSSTSLRQMRQGVAEPRLASHPDSSPHRGNNPAGWRSNTRMPKLAVPARQPLHVRCIPVGWRARL